MLCPHCGRTVRTGDIFNIGTSLRLLMMRDRIKATDLAKHVKCSVPTIYFYRINQRRPRPDLRKRIAAYFGVTEDELRDTFQQNAIIEDHDKRSRQKTC